MGDRKALVACALSCFVFSSTARGEEADPKPGPTKVEAGLFGGTFISTKLHQFYDVEIEQSPEAMKRFSPEVGLRLAYLPWRFFGFEAEGSWAFVKTIESDAKVDLFSARAHLVAQYPARITPFALLGGSWMWSRSSSEANGNDDDRLLHYGVGARFYMTPSFVLRADARGMRGPSNQPPFKLSANYAELTLGLSYAFGAKHPAPKDLDGDGFVGAADACPNEAGIAPDGCPAKDLDGDGLIGDADKCPKDPETVNGLDDGDGCPDQIADGDGDGIDDVADKCPKEPEDRDGVDDLDGCPDADPAPAPVPVAAAPRALPQRPMFDRGLHRIKRGARKELDALAAELVANPAIKKVRISGHADASGEDGANRGLSQKRADEVLKYLVKQGVAPERLEAVGRGEEAPVADNATAKGRAANRRVEIEVVEE